MAARTIRLARNVDSIYPRMPTVQPDPDGVVHIGSYEPPRVRRGVSVAAVGALVLSVFVAATSFIRLPYDTVAPGEARAVNPLVTIEGHPSYRARGQVLATTVAVRTAVNPYQALDGWIDPSVDVVPREEIRGSVPEATFERLNQEAMADSKTAAQVAALRHLGYTHLGVGAEITLVDRRYPAASVLQPGDVIVEIGGAPVTDSAEAVAAIAERQPGDRLALTLRRPDGAERRVTATAGESPEGKARLGVQLTTKVQLPFTVRIDSGKVTGPSAGLAYGLEVLDLLTPGELTGGVTVAATGDLTFEGRVNPVGGIRQKTVGVRRAGAKVFVVPKSNEAEARAAAGSGLRIVAVEDFDEAVRRLGTLAGSNALALGSGSGREAPPRQ